MRRLFFSLSVFLFSLVSCDRENAPDCFQSGGDEATEIRSLEGFSELELRDYIQYELVQSEQFGVEIRGPKNLLNDVRTDVKSGRLIISNENTCNFMRSYKRKIFVRISAPEFGVIDHYASGDVNSNDTIRQKRFIMNFRHATGRVNLKFHCDTVSLSMHTGSADCMATGISHTTELFAGGLGYLDASGLQTQNVFINQSSIQPLKAQASSYMFCLIKGRGDVLMYEEPDHSDVQIEAEGELIFMN